MCWKLLQNWHLKVLASEAQTFAMYYNNTIPRKHCWTESYEVGSPHMNFIVVNFSVLSLSFFLSKEYAKEAVKSSDLRQPKILNKSWKTGCEAR